MCRVVLRAQMILIMSPRGDGDMIAYVILVQNYSSNILCFFPLVDEFVY
jgi:hypothetical protein